MKIFGIQIQARQSVRTVERSARENADRLHPASLKDTFDLSGGIERSACSPRQMPQAANWPFESWPDIYLDAGPSRGAGPARMFARAEARGSGAALPALQWPLAVATAVTMRWRQRPESRYDMAEFLSGLDPEYAWGGRYAHYFEPLRFLSLASPA